ATMPVKNTDSTAVTPIATPSRSRKLRIGLVSDAAQSLDDRAALPQLLPNRLHVRVHRSGIHRPLVSPHPFEQPVPRKNDAAVPHEEHEQVELARGELHRLLADENFPTRAVDPDRTQREPLIVFGRGFAGFGTAEDRLHARDELTRAERLRHVIVGAEVEAEDVVVLAVASGHL